MIKKHKYPNGHFARFVDVPCSKYLRTSRGVFLNDESGEFHRVDDSNPVRITSRGAWLLPIIGYDRVTRSERRYLTTVAPADEAIDVARFLDLKIEVAPGYLVPASSIEELSEL